MTRPGAIGELLLDRSDGSVCHVAVRTSSSENNMKVGNQADFYVYIQRANSATPTIQIYSASEIAAKTEGGPVLVAAGTGAVDAWFKILRNAKAS